MLGAVYNKGTMSLERDGIHRPRKKGTGSAPLDTANANQTKQPPFSEDPKRPDPNSSNSKNPLDEDVRLMTLPEAQQQIMQLRNQVRQLSEPLPNQAATGSSQHSNGQGREPRDSRTLGLG
ncbi:hypothetical protein ABW19_dt0201382 [Dactylella cylindrospora]|nr:hypothetical protein ABW19_dt0201382 [Dactylella cylindrospora]